MDRLTRLLPTLVVLLYLEYSLQIGMRHEALQLRRIQMRTF